MTARLDRVTIRLTDAPVDYRVRVMVDPSLPSGRHRTSSERVHVTTLLQHLQSSHLRFHDGLRYRMVSDVVGYRHHNRVVEFLDDTGVPYTAPMRALHLVRS